MSPLLIIRPTSSRPLPLYCAPVAGHIRYVAAYDDSSWVQTLECLGLAEDNYDDAKLLLASKDSGFRQGLLGSTAECNKRVILKALSESYIECMGLL